MSTTLPAHPPITELIVCTTCRLAAQTREERPAGEALFEALQIALFDTDPDTQAKEPVVLRGVACMSGCGKACTVALQAAGKHSYLFGDLQPDSETALQALACARQHATSPDGLLAWGTQPERLRRSTLARLPPLVAPDASTHKPRTA